MATLENQGPARASAGEVTTPGADGSATPSGEAALSPGPLPLEGVPATVVPLIGRALKMLNRWFMVPALRMGLGPWVGTPFGGYILLLRVRGRRSGLWRPVPLSYLVTDGAVWVMAGFGPRTEWYRNLVADPEVEVWLPGRVLRCRAVVTVDPETRNRILPAVTRAAGAPGALIGCNPWTAPDGRILELLSGIPLIRIEPIDGPIAPGPDDPGGYGWIWRQALVASLTAWLVGLGWRAGRLATRRSTR